MAHINAIGASLFSELAIAAPLTPPASFSALDTKAEFDTLFATEIESGKTLSIELPYEFFDKIN